MVRDRFRLQTLLRLREAARDERRELLADALRVEAVLREQAARLEAELDGARRLQALPTGPIDVDRLLAAQRFEATLRLEQQGLARQQAAVSQTIDERRAALVEADRELKVVEKLKASHAERLAQDEARALVKRLDEVAGRRAREATP
jgi:flagellar export protein FliJ